MDVCRLAWRGEGEELKNVLTQIVGLFEEARAGIVMLIGDSSKLVSEIELDFECTIAAREKVHILFDDLISALLQNVSKAPPLLLFSEGEPNALDSDSILKIVDAIEMGATKLQEFDAMLSSLRLDFDKYRLEVHSRAAMQSSNIVTPPVSSSTVSATSGPSCCYLPPTDTVDRYLSTLQHEQSDGRPLSTKEAELRLRQLEDVFGGDCQVSASLRFCLIDGIKLFRRCAIAIESALFSKDLVLDVDVGSFFGSGRFTIPLTAFRRSVQTYDIRSMHLCARSSRRGDNLFPADSLKLFVTGLLLSFVLGGFDQSQCSADRAPETSVNLPAEIAAALIEYHQAHLDLLGATCSCDEILTQPKDDTSPGLDPRREIEEEVSEVHLEESQTATN